MTDDGTRDLPVLRWTEDFRFAEPTGYVPEFYEIGGGVVLDEHRLPLILDALLATHPEAERIRLSARERPGLGLDLGADGMIAVFLGDEPVGLFDRRLLVA